MTYTPEQLEEMADRHDRYSVCTQPARDHFSEVCRELAIERRRGVPVRDRVIAEVDAMVASSAGLLTFKEVVEKLGRAINDDDPEASS